MIKTTLLVISAIIALTSAGGYGHEGQDDGHAHYKFEYGVHDPHTHDIKSQHEERDGHHVIGGYTLKEADGTTRVVKYRSGPHSGFEAIVERIGHAQHPAHYGHGHEHSHGHGGVGGTSYVGVTHWGNQGHGGHEY